MSYTDEEKIIRGFRDVYNKMAALNKQEMETALAGYTATEVHLIEAIHDLAHPNVTQLAENLFLTRSAVTKLTQKLLKKQAITRYQSPENKKEILFSLTDIGQSVYKTHLDLHQMFRERDQPIFSMMDAQQKADLLHFLARYSQHLDNQTTKYLDNQQTKNS
ncbi:MarR family winged helix-turn-helix transcriptional regulator [Enterococcus sp. DIV0876]|uniref:MarR family winged helix-turn-helix transcriptional regulator n=1 Tax=Enterococcus sp. DIV0876 TaxID=2774633 RepID=UPI003D2FEACC